MKAWFDPFPISMHTQQLLNGLTALNPSLPNVTMTLIFPKTVWKYLLGIMIILNIFGVSTPYIDDVLA